MVSYFHMWDLIKIVRKRRHCKLFSTKRRHISFVCEVFKVIKSLSIVSCVFSCVVVHIECVHHKMIILLWSYFRTREIYFPFFISAGVHNCQLGSLNNYLTINSHGTIYCSYMPTKPHLTQYKLLIQSYRNTYSQNTHSCKIIF